MVVVAPGNMSGSTQFTIDGSVGCVDGDEGKVSVLGCAYASPPFTVPGVGTLTIQALGADQTGKQTTSSQTAVILKGSTFTAQFTVTVQTPPPGSSLDPVPQYTRTGQFVTTNLRVEGT